MPTETTRDMGNVIRLHKASGSSYVAAQAVEMERSITKPDRVRRNKPQDLFANATPYRVSSSEINHTIGVFDDGGYLTIAPASYWGNMGHAVGLRPPSSFADFADLDGEIRSRIKSMNMNLAQSLGEYKQTSKMFANAARDVYQTFQSLRSGRAMADFVRTLQHPDTRNGRRLANRWLEYQYGLRPLMNDVHEAAKLLQDKVNKGITRRTSVTRREQAVGSYKGPSYILSSSASMSRKVSARYTVSGPGMKQLSEVGITNPALLAWELIPYSFVVDWFVPVGDFLNGLDALTGVSNLLVQRSYGYNVSSTNIWYSSSKDAFFTSTPTTFAKERISQRFGVSGSLSFGRLAYKPSLSATKVANALALLRQLKR